jgi:hypothetical protein
MWTTLSYALDATPADRPALDSIGHLPKVWRVSYVLDRSTVCRGPARRTWPRSIGDLRTGPSVVGAAKSSFTFRHSRSVYKSDPCLGLARAVTLPMHLSVGRSGTSRSCVALPNQREKS